MLVDIVRRCFALDECGGAASKVVDCPDHRWVLSQQREGASSSVSADVGEKQNPRKIDTIIIIIGGVYYMLSTFLSI